MNARGSRYKAETYSPEEVLLFLESFDTDRPAGLRNRALVGILWGAGLRISEALALTPKDIGVDGAVHVKHGKNNRQRLIYLDTQQSLPDEMDSPLEMIQEWQEERGSLLEEIGVNQETAPLFCTRKGTGLKRQYTQQMLSVHAELAALSGRANAHRFRHSFAATQARAGTPVNVIQKLLGHSSLETTSRYIAHVDNSDLVEAGRNMPRL